MKYKEGDTVCLFDGRMVYVFAVDDSAKKPKLLIRKMKEYYFLLERKKYI